jgi:hypothetical protein
MSNEIENIFKEKFDNFEAAPREGLFDAILAKRKKKRRAIWMWSAAALVLLGTSYGILSNLPSDTPSTDSVVENNNPKKIIKTDDGKETIGFRQVDTYIGKTTENKKVASNDIEQQISEPSKGISESEGNSRPTIRDEQPETPRYVDTRPIKDEIPIISNPIPKSTLDSPISTQELADLYKQIAANDKNADITKAKLFTKTRTSEVDLIKGRNFISPKNEDPKTIIKKSTDQESPIIDVDGNEDKTTPPPIHKLVKLSKWSIETSAAGGIGGRSISGAKDYVSLRNLTESSKISTAISITGIYQIDPLWNVQAGFNYTNRRENFTHTSDDKTTYSQHDEIRTETIIHPVLGEIEREYSVTVMDTNTIDGITSNNTNNYKTINIPVVLERELINHKKWSVMAKGGAMVSIYGQTIGNIVNESNQITELNSSESRQSGMISGILGLGAMYAPTDRISIVLYPQANVGFNSRFNSNVAFTQREMGLYTHLGLRIKL